MDSAQATKVIIDRVSNMEPEHIAKKIIGYMYFLGLSDQEMIRLALGPDSLIHDLIQKAKNARILASSLPVVSPTISTGMNPPALPNTSFQFAPFPSVSPRPFSSTAKLRTIDPYLDPPQLLVEQPILQQRMPYIALEDPLDAVKMGPSSFPNDYYSPEAASNNLSIRGARNSMVYPVKICHYFSKGFCRHGSNCRYFHGESFCESYPYIFSPNSYDTVGDDQLFSPGSLDKLELEITELLKSRRGNPVSIASLPLLYYERYGKTLQAEGYLTESQRHGKAGYSLTKLLARLKNSIRLIDRPHGQHAVILAEDAAKFMEIRAEKNDPGPIVNGSRQIYLTFPAESNFTEEDVSNYFSTFGPVQDVRIPSQQRRMFGFVTFDNADTVKLVLSKGNPHFVCGARVLVKPYREKAKLVERKYMEKFDHPIPFQSYHTNIDLDLQTGCYSSSILPRHLIEENEHAVEFKAMRLAQLQLAGRPSTSQLDSSIDELPEAHSNFTPEEHFSYLFDMLNNGSTCNDNSKYPVNNCGDHESSNHPDSPLASVVASTISAVI